MPAAAAPEILEADLAPLALELAAWGAEPADLAFIDQPPDAAMAEARALLSGLGALDHAGRITPHGRAMAEQPVHPRLAHMRLTAGADGLGPEAALLAAFLSERDPFRGGTGSDISRRLGWLAGRASPDGTDRGAIERIRTEARRLAPKAKPDPAKAERSAGALLSLAYPDRIGLRRPGDAPRYLLSGGRGASLDPSDPLAGSRLLVAADLDDRGREATIRLAAPIAVADLRRLHGDRIGWEESAVWSRRDSRVLARRQERLGAIVLDERKWRDAPGEALGAALAEGIQESGLAALRPGPGATSLLARITWLRAQGGPLAERLPDVAEPALLELIDDWLTPHLAGLTRLDEAAALDIRALLEAMLGWELAQTVASAAPEHIQTPLGRRLALDYSREEPVLSVRLQEMFGQTRHPQIGSPPRPVLLELLSPAGRPVQITRDLPGFWAGSYADVAKEMRARYPKHPWPEDPWAAVPTLKARR